MGGRAQCCPQLERESSPICLMPSLSSMRSWTRGISICSRGPCGGPFTGVSKLRLFLLSGREAKVKQQPSRGAHFQGGHRERLPPAALEQGAPGPLRGRQLPLGESTLCRIPPAFGTHWLSEPVSTQETQRDLQGAEKHAPLPGHSRQRLGGGTSPSGQLQREKQPR